MNKTNDMHLAEEIAIKLHRGEIEEEEGFRKLFAAADPYVQAVIRGTAKASSDNAVEYLTSTVWEAVAENFYTRFDPEIGSFKNWIWTIAHHKAVDHIRSVKSSPVCVDLDSPMGCGGQTIGEGLEGPDSEHPLEVLLAKEKSEALLRTVLLELSDVNRTLYILHVNYDLSYKVLAAIASDTFDKEFTEKAIQNRIYRSRKKVYAALIEQGVLHED
mgnify:CR=1 FL=1